MEPEKITKAAKDMLEAARDTSRTLEEVFARSVFSTLNHPANLLSGMSLYDCLIDFLPIYREALRLADRSAPPKLLTFHHEQEEKPN